MKYLSIALVTLFILSNCSSGNITYPAGTYYGILPCASCPGIHYSIQFLSDSTYNESVFYEERSTEPEIHGGKFEMDKKGKIRLLDKKPEEGLAQMKLNESEILMLDIEGNVIEGSLEHLYVLTEEKPENFINYSDSDAKITGFSATGQSPDWTFYMDYLGNFQFKSNDKQNHDIRETINEAVSPGAELKQLYRVEVDSLTIEISILPDPCGTSNGKTVNIRLVTKNTGETTYTGCGTYQGDYRLNDIWSLVSISDFPMDSLTKAPNLEFNIREGKVYGFGGCNRISGSFEVKGDILTFSQMVSTKMACEQLNIESRFLAFLNGEIEFEIKEGFLELRKKGVTVIFKKVD